MKYAHRSVTAALMLVLLTSAVVAGENQLIDDFWMRGKAPRQAEPAHPAKTPSAAPPARGEATPTPAPMPAAAAPRGTTNVDTSVPAPTPALGAADSRIRPNDRVSVQVHQVDALSTTGTVTKDGKLKMPLIGPVAVGGLTSEEAESRIAEDLGRDYLQNPRVKVQIQGRGPSGDQGPQIDPSDSRSSAEPETVSGDRQHP